MLYRFRYLDGDGFLQSIANRRANRGKERLGRGPDRCGLQTMQYPSQQEAVVDVEANKHPSLPPSIDQARPAMPAYRPRKQVQSSIAKCFEIRRPCCDELYTFQTQQHGIALPMPTLLQKRNINQDHARHSWIGLTHKRSSLCHSQPPKPQAQRSHTQVHSHHKPHSAQASGHSLYASPALEYALQ